MTSLHDILLPLPVPREFARPLLFGVFSIHLLFVLLMLGTAILAMVYFLEALWHKRLGELRWDKKVLRMFLMHKSLAVVFGVGPLLLIQVAFSIPFFSAIAFFSPFWLLIIVFLILAFLSLDSLGHRIETHRYLHLFFGIVALILLLCVPGFFVAVLVAAENPDKWINILKTGFGFDWRISVHWVARYLHVLGASIVFAAAFHYFFTSPKYDISHRPALIKWMVGGLLFQVVVGFALYLSLLIKPDILTITYMCTGIILAAIMIWLGALTLQAGRTLNYLVAIPLLLFLLASMLLTRQRSQDRAFAGIMSEVSKSADEYNEKLVSYQSVALNHFKSQMNVIYNSGPTIYAQSCSFCHGSEANGIGPEASELKIPSEDLSAVRASETYLLKILKTGVDETAMPRFTYYDEYQQESVLKYLNDKYHIFSMPATGTFKITDKEHEQGLEEWKNTCSQCHGINGEISKLGFGFKPPPPDFREYSLTPDRILEVITSGYSGTEMPSFSNLPQSTRQALVEIVIEKRENTR